MIWLDSAMAKERVARSRERGWRHSSLLGTVHADSRDYPWSLQGARMDRGRLREVGNGDDRRVGALPALGTRGGSFRSGFCTNLIARMQVPATAAMALLRPGSQFFMGFFARKGKEPLVNRPVNTTRHRQFYDQFAHLVVVELCDHRTTCCDLIFSLVGSTHKKCVDPILLLG